MGESTQADIRTILMDPESVMENLANLFYDQRPEEAKAAAGRVMAESRNSYRMGAGDFVDFVVFKAYQKSMGLRDSEKTPFQKEMDEDIARFVEYFDQEVAATEYLFQ